MAADDRAQRVLVALRRRGGRVTPARRAMVQVLFSDDDHEHLTADRVAVLVRERLPNVHVSTVYRFLEVLEGLGVVDHVHLGHGRAVYHLTSERHAHVVCQRCGRVVEVDGGALDALSARLEAEHGVRLVAQHFALAGECQGCVGRRDDP
ncbi:MAG: transcriptional repressor [Acidimicrobiales bacterium]|nr:transcriptional repressor [Acidimicrobiales bacterium]